MRQGESSGFTSSVRNIFRRLKISDTTSSQRENSSLYNYSPLEGDQIRLLRVRKKSGRLDYGLEHFKFESAPQYTALSYCWEDQVPDQDLICDDASLLVTTNVKVFLPYLSKTDGTFYVWIDAICSNQSDTLEKNHQVGLMKTIYKSAVGVVIWLGESNESVDHMAEVLLRVSSYWNYDTTKIHSGEPKYRDVIVPPGGLFWDGVEFLLTRPWFARIWTFQEAILPKNVEFLCGRNNFSYDIFTELIEVLSNPLYATVAKYSSTPLKEMLKDRNASSRALSRYANVGRRRWVRIVQCRKMLATVGHVPWHMLLSYGRFLMASKPSDKIYGMLGLADDTTRSLITVDYRTDYREVYTNFMRICMRTLGHATLLHLIDGYVEGLPTWCPTFSELEFSIGLLYDRSFRAGMRDVHSFYKTIDTSSPVSGQDPKSLPVPGFRLDTIVKSIPYPTVVREFGNGSASLQKILRSHDAGLALVDWAEECLRMSQHVYSQPNSIPDAHIRNLTCIQRSGPGYPWPSIQSGDYKLLMAYVAEELYKNTQHVRWQSSEALDKDQRARGTLLFREVIRSGVQHSYFCTTLGRIGIGPINLQADDYVCLLDGTFAPFILRSTLTDAECYKLVGDCYIDGLMYGEAFGLEESEHTEIFTLV